MAQIEEMPGLVLGRRGAVLRPQPAQRPAHFAAAMAWDGRQRRVPRRIISSPVAISSSVITSGGTKRRVLSPAVMLSRPSAAECLLHLAARHAAFQAEHQPGAAHRLEHLRLVVHQLVQRAPQHAPLAVHVLEEAGRQHHVQHRVGRRAGERVAAEGGAVGAGLEVFGHRLLGEHGAHREAAGDALAADITSGSMPAH